MKKIYLIVLLLATVVAACGKHDDATTAPAASPQVSAPASATTTAPATSSSVAVLPMARTVADCGKPGFNSDSEMCAQAAEQKTAAHRVLYDGHGSAINRSSALPTDAVAAINDQLAKLGSLSVAEVNPQGYPIFEMECNAKDQCVNGVGIPMGSVSDVVKQMTTVRQSDIQKYGWKCEAFCKDGQGNIIGRPE